MRDREPGPGRPRAAWLLLAALAAACSGDAIPDGTDPAASAGLAVQAVELSRVARETAFDGAVEAINQSTVSAQTTGRVVELPFDVGDYVEKDAVIVRFTTTEQRARSSAAAASLAEADARLAEAQLAYDRMRDVYEKRLVAKAQFDKAASDLDAARARAAAAQASLTEAREGLGYTVIRAPYAGIVVARHVQLGETVAPGRPLMTGLSLEHLRAIVEVPQQHIGPLRRHRKARVILPDGQSVAAAELRIPPAADPSTHTFRVLVTLPPGEHAVFPGTLVKVAFVSGEDERVLIPAASVVRRGEVAGAYVVDEAGRISLRYLRLGTAAADGGVPVLAGLAAGERIATDPIAAGIAYKQQSAAPAGDRE
ncbi:MAG TPA: efflux RND transporter periplasmic adaptor subunit [Steroidobacteraceae bacterium]|nr:efflux RND transporter periplasmic adaptor subunit [Steroidobacteraceae bacterium]